jgi:hypothetical protein
VIKQLARMVHLRFKSGSRLPLVQRSQLDAFSQLARMVESRLKPDTPEGKPLSKLHLIFNNTESGAFPVHWIGLYISLRSKRLDTTTLSTSRS